MKRILNKSFKISFLILCLFGIFVNLIDSPNIIEQISYFTMASNSVVAIVLILELLLIFNIYKVNKGFLRVFKGSAIISTLVTLIVYNFVLVPYLQTNNVDYQIFGYKDLLIHYITPILIFLDYLIFDVKGQYQTKDLLPLIGYPFGYIVYIIIYVLLGGRFTITGVPTKFPYFFFNYEVQGVGLTLVIMVGLVAMFYGLGGLLVFIDNTLKRNTKSVSL